ncbi:MAG TPA: CBS domain-containing protein [bacterium]|nr:CBS domain-containing protein [bacterium]
MFVKQICTERSIIITAQASLKEAMRMLIEHRISGLIVTDGHDTVVGMLSEKDILQRLLPTYAEFMADPVAAMKYKDVAFKIEKAGDMTVGDIMSTPVLTIGPEEHVMKACAEMIAHHIRRLPVVEPSTGKLIGIVSMGDVFRGLLTKVQAAQ